MKSLKVPSWDAQGMTYGSTWEDQWKRIERWKDRVRASRDTPRVESLGTEAYRDEVFALFQSIWHFKDWLINDPAAGLTKKQVEDWIFDKGVRRYLLAAHDLANGSKHLTLDKAPKVDAAQIRNDAKIVVGVGHSHTFYIRIADLDQEFEAVVLADMCMDEWRGFLASHGLTPP